MPTVEEFFGEVTVAMKTVAKHDALTLPDGLLDRVKLLALIDALNALDSALSRSEEAKMSTAPDERSYQADLRVDYAKAQIEMTVNLEAVRAQVKEAA